MKPRSCVPFSPIKSFLIHLIPSCWGSEDLLTDSQSAQPRSRSRRINSPALFRLCQEGRRRQRHKTKCNLSHAAAATQIRCHMCPRFGELTHKVVVPYPFHAEANKGFHRLSHEARELTNRLFPVEQSSRGPGSSLYRSGSQGGREGDPRDDLEGLEPPSDQREEQDHRALAGAVWS
ncbi:hypothetical protein SKAU_G00364640 [Synaphobranchus kaupii]|uniref:Uncharacterized protein n=1 Tax=Synaphobranchus kaupii TaxID=118154 RepID=A0A9Q1ID81_SYNKA|nr:hypothetical protein SKAU_G00364640 [Synaphobranchus kaupii]